MYHRLPGVHLPVSCICCEIPVFHCRVCYPCRKCCKTTKSKKMSLNRLSLSLAFENFRGFTPSVLHMNPFYVSHDSETIAEALSAETTMLGSTRVKIICMLLYNTKLTFQNQR